VNRFKSTLFLIPCVSVAWLSAWGIACAQTSGSTQQISTPAQAMCPNAHLWGASLVTNICWSCLFPLKIMGVAQLGGGSVPSGSATDPICFCSGSDGIESIGFTLGLWEPEALIELVRQPYCSPSLGGTRIRNSFKLWGMKDGSDGGSASNQFLNYHYFSFPLYEILQLLITPECNAGGFSDFDLLYISEIDPTWSEDELAMFTQPEVAVASNPLLQATCPLDCTAATVATPIDKMWWCFGCWGNAYPFTGNVPSGGSPPRVSSLLATRALAALHRRGLAWRTTGNDVLCGGVIDPMIPKSQYKMSMLYPVPEANSSISPPGAQTAGGSGQATAGSGGSGAAGTTSASIPNTYNYHGTCCHNIGVPTFLWGEWRNIPAVGEDFVYLLWRWTDCCVR
jgi:conjugal transfer pilus assembly protein TraU